MQMVFLFMCIISMYYEVIYLYAIHLHPFMRDYGLKLFNLTYPYVVLSDLHRLALSCGSS